MLGGVAFGGALDAGEGQLAAMAFTLVVDDGGVAVGATGATVDASLTSVGTKDSLNAKGATAEVRALGVHVGETVAP